jgi:hypothetical protein
VSDTIIVIVIVIVLVVVVVILLLLFSSFGKNPAAKTTEQLEKELELHNRVISLTNPTSNSLSSRLEARNNIEAELKSRRQNSETSKQTECDVSESDIRKLVASGFEVAWQKAKQEGKNDEVACETALVGGLLNRIVRSEGWDSVSPTVVQSIMLETLPFKNLGSRDDSLDALVEYAVWREFPENANKAKIQFAVSIFEDKADKGFVMGIKSSDFAWTKLLRG